MSFVDSVQSLKFLIVSCLHLFDGYFVRLLHVFHRTVEICFQLFAQVPESLHDGELRLGVVAQKAIPTDP